MKFMKKSVHKAAVFLAALIVLTFSGCRGMELAESSNHLPVSSGQAVSSETSAAGGQDASEQVSSLPESPAGVSSEEPVSSEETSVSSKEESVLGNAPMSSEGMDAASAPESRPADPVWPKETEPEKTDPLVKVEEKILEANVEAKAAGSLTEQENISPPQQPAESASSEPPVSPVDSSYSAQNQEEMKAVWLSFLEFQGFSGSSESSFTAKIQSIFDTISAKGLNTVIVQVRPHGDSFYESEYYPWSKCVSGVMGQGVDYDPLDIMVTQAHARGLSIHAWINPYRTMTEQEFSTVDSSYPVQQWHLSDDRKSYMVYNQSDGRWWLQPGNPQVQKLIIDGAREIVERYEVDGLHLDDYFYCADPAGYGDTQEEAKFNTTVLVKGLYDAVKQVNPSVQFGISPAGSFRLENSLPESDRNYLSTDLALWCSANGYLDYVMPQIYWEHGHSVQPFSETLFKWEQLVTAPGVKLYVGLAPYRLSAGEIESQVAEILAEPGADGYCLFRYDFIHGLNLPG